MKEKTRPALQPPRRIYCYQEFRQHQLRQRWGRVRWRAPAKPFPACERSLPNLLPDRTAPVLQSLPSSRCIGQLQCLAEIRRINGLKKTPVVIYTTATSVEKQNGVHELDPVHFLSKPARFKEIVNSLDEILKSKWMYDA